MNRTSHILLTLFIFAILSYDGAAAPVGNLGDSMLWSPSPFEKEGGLSIVTTLSCERQTNRLVDQMTRFAWTNPDAATLEERHFSQTRSSKNSMNTIGIKLGIPIKDRWVCYGLVGTSEADIDFHYSDMTVSRSDDNIENFGTNFSKDYSFESDSNIYYGFGTSLIMHRGDYEKIPLTLGMDMSYRRYTVEQETMGSKGLLYSSTLDELQLAFCLSAETKLFSPYLGFKVASMTGTEEFIHTRYLSKYYKEGYIHYEEDITWSKNLGFFLGVTTVIKKYVTVGMEYRSGDENAFGVNATTRF